MKSKLADKTKHRQTDMKDNRKRKTGQLRVGAAQMDITPKAGTHLAGGGAGEHRPAKTVLDPLHAKAVVFETDGRKICFLSLDVTIVTAEWTERIRKAASERWGFDPDAVMVHATQTHSAPPLGHFMFDPDFPELPPEMEYLRGGETSYYEDAVEKAIEAIEQANNSLTPAKTGVGSAVRDDLAFNRRAVTRDGSVTMPWTYSKDAFPLGPTQIRYMEGPTDPEVGVFCARDASGRMIAMLVHHTCHPVNVFGTPATYYAVSADWPGAWGAELQSRFGKSCVPLVLNGCCGNINPWPPFKADFIPDHQRMGHLLGELTGAVVGQMKFSDSERIEWKVRRLSIPLKAAEPERLAQARKILQEHPKPLWQPDASKGVEPAWFQAASVMSVELMRKRSPTLLYEIQVLRVGDTAFVGLPGEPFVEGQLAIKIGSPACQTYVAHATSQYVGYIPVSSAFPHGGHEVNFSYWAKLAPEALEMIVNSAIGLLRELFQK